MSDNPVFTASDDAVSWGVQCAFSQAAAVAQESFSAIGIEQTRPSVLYRPRLSVDGNQWCALYGDNLQDGVAGFGDSPELAMAAFDEQWRKRLP